MLTPILEFWRLIVPVEVTMRIDNGMLLTEMIWTFLADPVSVLWERPDTSTRGTGVSFGYKAENACLLHLPLIKLNL